jgi:hypothetical protein
MEYDAEVTARCPPRLFDWQDRELASALPELWLLLSDKSDISGLTALDFKREGFVSYSWSSSTGELALEFVHTSPHQICEILLEALSASGFQNPEALIYSDECDCVVDDDGVVHRLGERMYINSEGVISVEDYPEVEYRFI